MTRLAKTGFKSKKREKQFMIQWLKPLRHKIEIIDGYSLLTWNTIHSHNWLSAVFQTLILSELLYYSSTKTVSKRSYKNHVFLHFRLHKVCTICWNDIFYEFDLSDSVFIQYWCPYDCGLHFYFIWNIWTHHLWNGYCIIPIQIYFCIIFLVILSWYCNASLRSL